MCFHTEEQEPALGRIWPLVCSGWGTKGPILAESFSSIPGGKEQRREPEYEAFGWLVSTKDDPLQVWLVLKKIGIGISSISMKKRGEM